jgi:aromatic ring-opening dioxygenase LigB subunit
MCHAPIVLPEVGGFRSIACAETTRAMHDVARRLLATQPDVLVVISPHSPRKPEAWGIYGGPEITGGMEMFGAPEVSHTLPVPQDAVAALRTAAKAEGLETWTPPNGPLDHGAMVPLHFVVAQGWGGPTLLLSLPWPGTHTEATMGRAIAHAAAARGERWSVLASGDMSHRLKPGAPSGYHPRAHEFDQALVDAIKAGDLRAAANIPSELRDLAAEDAVDTITVAASAVDWESTGHECVSYEGPFGVGYMEAVLYTEPGAGA